MLDVVYGRVAAARRAWYERHADRRIRLSAPVISVGNLSVGGTGKTPVVAALATALLARGERPSVLSRGYKRRAEARAVTIVADGARVRATVEASGDEPLMLARAVPGAIVVVAADRAAAGRAAESACGATVHLLDDGFQHLRLARDLDLVVTRPGDIASGRVLPFGRLRETPQALDAADALIVVGAGADEAAHEAAALGVAAGIGAQVALGVPEPVGLASGTQGAAGARDESGTEGAAGAPRRDQPVVALAGIARPERFVDALRADGWQVVDVVTRPDHHWFTSADLARVGAAVRASGAVGVLTTAKDAVRLEVAGPLPAPIWQVPLRLQFDPWPRLEALVVAALMARRSPSGAYGAAASAGVPA